MGYDGETANPNERPAHTVAVSTFRLDRTEVTVAAYAECVREVSAASRTHTPMNGARVAPSATGSTPKAVTHRSTAWTSSRRQRSAVGEANDSRRSRNGACARAETAGRILGNAAPNETRLNACGTECPANAKRRTAGLASYVPGQRRLARNRPVGSYRRRVQRRVLDLAGTSGMDCVRVHHL